MRRECKREGKRGECHEAGKEKFREDLSFYFSCCARVKGTCVMSRVMCVSVFLPLAQLKLFFLLKKTLNLFLIF